LITLLPAVGSLLSFRVRSRASLELELVALRHQVTVLRRQRPGQLRIFSTDRLLWVWAPLGVARLDTPPISFRHHPVSGIARRQQVCPPNYVFLRCIGPDGRRLA